jgi:hypothetical protein
MYPTRTDNRQWSRADNRHRRSSQSQTTPPPPDIELRRTAPMDVPVNYMDIPIEPIVPPHIEVDPSLRTIRQPIGDPRDSFDVPVPELPEAPSGATNQGKMGTR